MKKKLKLFVWEGVLCDESCGMMVALAPNVETARQMLLEKWPYISTYDLLQTPQVYTTPHVFAVWGGS